MAKSKRLTKSRLIEELSESCGLSKNKTEKLLNSALASISSSLSKGESVQLSGFGTFYVRKRAARTGFNPSSMRKMSIKAKNIPAFKPGDKLKKAVH